MNIFSEHCDSDTDGSHSNSDTEAESDEEDDIRLPGPHTTSEEYLALSKSNQCYEQENSPKSGQLASTHRNKIQNNGSTEDDEMNNDILSGLFCL